MRKTPSRHFVKLYYRDGKIVHGHFRGSGVKEAKHPSNPVNPKAPWYYKPDENSLNEELKELGSGITVDVGGRYGYKALDLFKNGNMQDTLITQLTKKEAEKAIDIIYRYVHELHRHPESKVELILGGRYGYTAIDLYRDGRQLDTLATHLTRKKADNLVWIASRVQGELERDK